MRRTEMKKDGDGYFFVFGRKRMIRKGRTGEFGLDEFILYVHS